MAMFSVVQQRFVPASLHTTWRLLTEPPLVSEWFADCEHLSRGEPCRFDFGDGDYFAASVIDWDAPHHLALMWRFMDVGPLFTIEYDLEGDGTGTLVTVHDTGSASEAEAEGLGEGWSDFLSRLAERARTGKPCRYRWSPSIGTAAVLSAPLPEAATPLRNESWWRTVFPLARVTLLEREDHHIVARVSEPRWADVTTTITLDLRPYGDGTYVGVVHGGWDALPETTQVDERKRYAERWAHVLKRLEGAGAPAALAGPLER